MPSAGQHTLISQSAFPKSTTLPVIGSPFCGIVELLT